MSKLADKIIEEFPEEVIHEGLSEEEWKAALDKISAAHSATAFAIEALYHLADKKAWVADQSATKAETAKIRNKLKDMGDDMHANMLPKMHLYREALQSLETSAKRFYKLHAKGKKV